jgi:hypothetical protein
MFCGAIVCKNKIVKKKKEEELVETLAAQKAYKAGLFDISDKSSTFITDWHNFFMIISKYVKA